MGQELRTETRTHCAVCGGDRFTPLQNIENFPVLPICTEQDVKLDLRAPLAVVLCGNCGCFQLRTLVDRAIIYSSAHSEGIGATWVQHYVEFAAFIRERAALGTDAQVLEVGAGLGQVVRELAPRCKLSVIEPNYGGPREQVNVIDGFFTPQGMKELSGRYDVIYSSHTLEHFFDFREYFEAARVGLKPGGRLLTAIPNLESGLQAGFANAFHFEHTAMLMLPHVLALHANHGFEVTGVSYYRDHGIYVSATHTDRVREVEVDTRQYSTYLSNRLFGGLQAQKKRIESSYRPGVPHYLFGASQLSQFLFAIGLDAELFDGLLDNAKLKHERRLYGTPLISRLPDPVVRQMQSGQIFINGGPYTGEILAQLRTLAAPGVELIPV